MLDISTSKNILTAYGLISRKPVQSRIEANNSLGIRFIHPCGEIIEADVANIFSTQRNTVLAKNNNCICLTEHFMAAAACANLTNVDVFLDAEELPFADGSAMFWFDFFTNHFHSSPLKTFFFEEEIKIIDESDASRFILLQPALEFSASYQLISNHNYLKTQSYTWNQNLPCSDLLRARTFSSYSENQILGLENWVLGFDDNGFKQDLFFDNEPARHKLLDLIGDLYLSGFNPLALKAKITSVKAGHELNSRMAKKIKEVLS